MLFMTFFYQNMSELISIIKINLYHFINLTYLTNFNHLLVHITYYFPAKNFTYSIIVLILYIFVLYLFYIFLTYLSHLCHILIKHCWKSLKVIFKYSAYYFSNIYKQQIIICVEKPYFFVVFNTHVDKHFIIVNYRN